MMTMKILNKTHMLGIIENIEITKITQDVLVRHDVGTIEHLASSIAAKGLLHPIMVKISGSVFKIVAGNRRFLACKRLGWRKIPCHVVELSDKESFEISLIENIQRKTMNPIEEGESFKKYVDEHGWGGMSELSKQIGKSQEYISKRIKLLELPNEICEKIIRREIKPSMAEELAYIKDKDKLSKIVNIIVKHPMTIQKVREITKSSTIDVDMLSSDSLIHKKNHVSFFDKTSIILKLTNRRLDEIIEDVDDYMVKEFLTHQRIMIHSQIDNLIKCKKKYEQLNARYLK